MDYSRQNKLREMPYAEEKLKSKKVAIIGMGALGSTSSEQMVRNGIGELLLVDDDCVEEKNICKTNIYQKKDVGKRKVDIAKEKLEEINEETKIRIATVKLTKENAKEILKDIDLILDGTDSIIARQTIDYYAQSEKKPWIRAAVEGVVGTVVPFLPGVTPCFNCLYGTENESFEDEKTKNNGIINQTIQITTAYQTIEALKILSDKIEDVILEERVFNAYTLETNYYELEHIECKHKEELKNE